MSITRDEWLKALAHANIASEEDDQEAVTATEFAALFQVPVTTARTRLRALVDRGLARETKKMASDTRGHRKQLTAYRLTT